MISHDSNYFAGIDTGYISSRVSHIDRNQDPVKVQLAVAKAIFDLETFLPYIDGLFILRPVTRGDNGFPNPENNPVSIRGHQIEIQNPNPESVHAAKRLEYGLEVLGQKYTIVNTSPEGDLRDDLVNYAGEALPSQNFELEYRLITLDNFHTAPLIVAHHRYGDQSDPLEEVRRGRIVLVDSTGKRIETIADKTCEHDAEAIRDTYRQHGLKYSLARVTADEELAQLWKSHHLFGRTIFSGFLA